MTAPRVNDDGNTVELDLHGVNVGDAMALVNKAIGVSLERGRSTMRVIHGSSTSDALVRNRTIKHALEDQLEQGLMGVTAHYMMEDVTILSLAATSERNPSPITLFELR